MSNEVYHVEIHKHWKNWLTSFAQLRFDSGHDGTTPIYEIRIEGHLDTQWADWFDGMSITREADGKTLLSGPVPDQPALYGLLHKVRDLGIPLVSVNLQSDVADQQNSYKFKKGTIFPCMNC